MASHYSLLRADNYVGTLNCRVFNGTGLGGPGASLPDQEPIP